ncbi:MULTISPECIES: hypothetical protein [Bradyrhizobium]|uniref:hypothetical protein n=1 Tax=Bradyrhizobium TaxID=374 RepID=UPI00155E5E71|nr:MULTISPECIES: hypothetical protein [Bradyrhizobium]UWU71224.1 hypothetical protein N2602_12010 [Bradyrhizobium sp. NC92]
MSFRDAAARGCINAAKPQSSLTAIAKQVACRYSAPEIESNFNAIPLGLISFCRPRGLLIELMHKLCASHKECANRKFRMRNRPATVWRDRYNALNNHRFLRWQAWHEA